MEGKIELSENQKKILFAGFVYTICRAQLPYLTKDKICEIVNKCIDDLEKMGAKGGT